MDHPAAAGEHRVINQAVETRTTVLEIAHLVQRLAAERGIEVELCHKLDPRHERERPSRGGPARNVRLRQSGIPTLRLEDGVRQLMDDLLSCGESLSGACSLPSVDWKAGAASGIEVTV
jgi:hypothetical protein